MNRQHRLSGNSLITAEKGRSPSPASDPTQFGSSKDLSILLTVNHNSTTTYSKSGNRTPGSNNQSRNSAGSYISSSSPKNQLSGNNFPSNTTPNQPTSHQTYNLFDKGNDPILWASRLDLREKAHFALQEFSTLAKVITSR